MRASVLWAALVAITAAFPARSPAAPPAGSHASDGPLRLADLGKRRAPAAGPALATRHSLKGDSVFIVIRGPRQYDVYKRHSGTIRESAFMEAWPAEQATLNGLRVQRGLRAITDDSEAMAARRDHEFSVWQRAHLYGASSVPEKVDVDGRPYLKVGFAGFSSESVLRTLAEKRSRDEIDQANYAAGVNFVISTAIDTLATLEQAGIVHRDPHAGNLTIMTDTGQGRLKGQAIDFGISKYAGEAEADLQIRLAGFADVMGKDNYKPGWADEPRIPILAQDPSIARRSYADHKSDLYYFLSSVTDILSSGDAGQNVAITNSLNQMRLNDQALMQSAKQYTEYLKGVYLPGWHQGQAIVRTILEERYTAFDNGHVQP